MEGANFCTDRCATITPMTKLLERAIENVRKLPSSEQAAAAEALFVHIAGEPRYRLTDAQVAEVRRIRKGLKSGKTKLLGKRQMSAFWKKLGV